MTEFRQLVLDDALEPGAVFPAPSRAEFAAAYPEGPHRLRHTLHSHPLLDLSALAQLAEALAPECVEYNRGDLRRSGNDTARGNGLTIGETIRGIEISNSWVVLKNIEQDPTYRALVEELLAELEPEIRAKTGGLPERHGFIFISSPHAVTPYHLDPEHNILMQLAGSKVVTVFPAGDPQFAPDAVQDSQVLNGARDLAWRDELACHGLAFRIAAGEALYIPVMAPHHVKNGPTPSISLSLTWGSEWSLAEADARAFNAVLRRWGYFPGPPARWPSRNRVKAIAWRILRRFPGIR